MFEAAEGAAPAQMTRAISPGGQKGEKEAKDEEPHTIVILMYVLMFSIYIYIYTYL